MSTIGTSPSNNGRGSEAWSGSWTHFIVDRRSPSYCRVTRSFLILLRLLGAECGWRRGI
jgi:hypothetical protein